MKLEFVVFAIIVVIIVSECYFLASVFKHQQVNKNNDIFNYKILKSSDDSRCGESSILMVLDYYKIEATEEEICKLTKHTYESGTTDSLMVSALQSYGLKVELKDSLTLEDLVLYTHNYHYPIIVNYFSVFLDDEGKLYSDEGTYSHSSVVVNIDDKYIYLADPYYGKIIRWSRNNFERNWFDWREGEYINCNNIIFKQALIVKGF